MAALDDLLARVEDEALRNALDREIAPLRGERELGLVFERHLPEKVRLAGLPIRRGATVEVRCSQLALTWQVAKVANGKADLRRRGDDGCTATETYAIEDLVVVREFGQPIYPGLKSVGRIERGGNKPFHAVINAENYHALETLLYTCEGHVDAIYLDPPYNSGARDWKYNNDYVDGNDGYRHSKWLSFMEKRLLLAKRLLNPENSVLIVTIDEKEYLRLGMLLEQVFPNARIQMVSVRINPSGVARLGDFRRSDEYAYFVRTGDQVLTACDLGPEWLGMEQRTGPRPLAWNKLRRTGTNTQRTDRPNLFYPLFIDPSVPCVHSVGEAIALAADRTGVVAPEGTLAVWPIRSDGSEGNWQIGPETLRTAIANGFVMLGQRNTRGYAVYYLKSGEQKRVTSEFEITGKKPDGSVQLQPKDGSVAAGNIPTTQWLSASHDAATHGSRLLQELVPGRKFPFPKALYAVEDALRFFVKDKPNALVIDFFGGSGTTTHALMRLNHQDGGQRRSILVTNNEIGPDAEKQMTEDGKSPGDQEWDALGIFQYITKPRLEAAVTGKTYSGEAVKGEYRFTDEFPMSEGFEENIEFFTLTYEDADRVRLGAAFAAIAPMLWLMAGAVGPRVDKAADDWALPDGGRYGVLFDADAFPGFVEAVKSAEGATHAFVVTDSDTVFQRVVAELPDTVTPVRLYESYLRSFAINTGASA
jgi:adenine-specific DNA-methyltransferase